MTENDATALLYQKRREHQQQPTLSVTIASATYGPCEQVSNGAERISRTRDVTPFICALLQLLALEQPQHEEEERESICIASNSTCSQLVDDSLFPPVNPEDHHRQQETTVTLSAIYQGQRRALIELLPSPNNPDSSELSSFATKYSSKNQSSGPGPLWGMNGIFGDPIPGTSKRLTIQYRITASDDDENEQGGREGMLQTDSFAEHERVCLRCRHWNWGEENRPSNNKSSNADINTDNNLLHNHGDASAATAMSPLVGMHSADSIPSSSSSPHPCSSSTATSKSMYQDAGMVVLPWIMTFLEVPERVQCQLVCKSWCHGIREWGVATILDDSATLAIYHGHERDTYQQPNTSSSYSRAYLRGVLHNSYTSLHSLYLCSTPDITKDDIHPALRQLEKLRCLDVSRCRHLDDSTLELLATSPARNTLRVLYLKGLDRVTDQGVITMARSCIHLTTLDLSQISAITDRAGQEIGNNLKHLKALFLRDNYQLTNESIDTITNGIGNLQQLTLWGCIRIRHLNGFGGGNDCHRLDVQPCNIVMLNLRGCHNLDDDAARALQCMQLHLRSLDVSECHRLTDKFMMDITQYVPQLNHLHLRYCQKITDTGLRIIADRMQDLYALDLSFCTKVTVSGIYHLLETRGDVLAELRLWGCRMLDIASNPITPFSNEGGYAGRQILAVLRLLHRQHRHCGLSILDLRLCQGMPRLEQGYSDDDAFVKGMKALAFEQKVPGFFSRPVMWNHEVQKRILRDCRSRFPSKIH